MMKFECANCGQHLEAEDNQTGRSFDCPNCGSNVVAPNAPVNHQTNAKDSPVHIPENDDKTECDTTPSQRSAVENPSGNSPLIKASQTDANSDSKPADLFSDQHTSTKDTEGPKRQTASLKTVLVACWREAFDSGFVPFVVHGIKDACKTMFDFARKPYATLVRFSDAEKQKESKALLASSVSLFIAVYWVVDKIVGAYSEAFQTILDDRLESGLYLNSNASSEAGFASTQATKVFCELFGKFTQSLELTIVFLLLGLIFTTYYLFRRKSTIDPSFHDEDTSRFIRPTLLFACGNGMMVSLLMLVSPVLMIFAYLGYFGIFIIAAYFLLIGACSFYMLWGYVKWLSHYFSVTKKRAIITYMIVGWVFNMSVQIIYLIIVFGPVMLVDKVFG